MVRRIISFNVLIAPNQYGRYMNSIAYSIRYVREGLFKLACAHRPVIARDDKWRDPVRQPTSTIPPSVNVRPRIVARTFDHQPMVRGLVNGVILSLAIWLTAGYLTFILR